MSTILSLKEIRELTFNPLPRKPRKVSKMVSTGKTVVFVEGKTIYTNRVDANVSYPPGSEPWWFDEVWSCLKKLRVLSAEVIEEHKNNLLKENKIRVKKAAAVSILRDLEHLDLDTKLSLSLKKELLKIVKP